MNQMELNKIWDALQTTIFVVLSRGDPRGHVRQLDDAGEWIHHDESGRFAMVDDRELDQLFDDIHVWYPAFERMFGASQAQAGSYTE